MEASARQPQTVGKREKREKELRLPELRAKR
jgi:hypothetical protein